MRIVMLVENTVYRTGLVAEHGLACLVEAGGRSTLWDTGQGAALQPNAKGLGVDLEAVEAVALSHGHFDHTGGLGPLLRRIGGREVWAHDDVFQNKLAVRPGHPDRTIGLPVPRADLEAAGARFRSCLQPVELAPGLVTSGPVPRVTDFEAVSPRFQVRENGSSVPDLILDDQFMLVDSPAGPVVLMGCAHSGLINTLIHAADLAGTERFAAVVGGTHLVDADQARLTRTVEELRRFEIGTMAACHCTGFRGQVVLSQAFGERYRSMTVGEELRL